MKRKAITILFGAIPSTILLFPILTAGVMSAVLMGDYWSFLLIALLPLMGTLGLWIVGLTNRYPTIINLALISGGVFYLGRSILNTVISNPQILVPTSFYYIIIIGVLLLFSIGCWYIINISKSLFLDDDTKTASSQSNRLNHPLETSNRSDTKPYAREPIFVRSLIDTWLFFKHNAITMAFIILPITLPLSMVSALYQHFLVSEELSGLNYIVMFIIEFIGHPIYSVAIIYYIASKVVGRDYDIKDLWSLGIKLWIPFAIYSLLYTVAITLGILLLLIPGLIFIARFSFAKFELILQESTPLDAMRKSWKSTEEYMWRVLGGYLLISMIVYLPLYSAYLLFNETIIYSLPLLEPTFLSIFSTIFLALCTIFSFRVYEGSKEQ